MRARRTLTAAIVALLLVPMAAGCSSSGGGSASPSPSVLTKQQYCDGMKAVWSGNDLPEPTSTDSEQRKKALDAIAAAQAANASSSLALNVLDQQQVAATAAALNVLTKIYQASPEAVEKAFSSTKDEDIIAALGLTKEEWQSLQDDQLDTVGQKVSTFCGGASASPSGSPQGSATGSPAAS